MERFLAFLLLLLLSSPLFSQEKERNPFALEADFFYGNILEHNPKIQHLITGHPTGFVMSLNRKTYGFNEWERRYNYPDWGFSLAHQDMRHESLGEVLAVYGHLNWYFLKRHLRFQIGQGIAYANNPYDYYDNYNNSAYGTHLMSTTYLKASFVRENLWKGFGLHAGLLI